MDTESITKLLDILANNIAPFFGIVGLISFLACLMFIVDLVGCNLSKKRELSASDMICEIRKKLLTQPADTITCQDMSDVLAEVEKTLLSKSEYKLKQKLYYKEKKND